MTWTKEKPTKPGFYWMHEQDIERLVRVSGSGIGLDSFYVTYHGSDLWEDLDEAHTDTTEWSGPIEPPKEAGK